MNHITRILLGGICAGVPLTLSAQTHMETSGGAVQAMVGAQAIAAATRESPAVGGQALTEGYLTQPAIMLRLATAHGGLVLNSTLNLEGLTLDRGELTPGIYGEGYIDRRHPHTYLHELMLTARADFRIAAGSVSLGKGFVPFGTDDPMSRPFEKYPVNHHLSQILERVVAIGAVKARGVILEGGVFNGDEPQGPGDVPNRNRYWDSWAGRLTLIPFAQGEIQGSYARVKSPENAAGGGLDQRKQSASIRLEDAQHSGYALVEWARTGDYSGDFHTFDFTSMLAESGARIEFARVGLRFERTQRPDEERLQNVFRTPVPATDLSIIGRSQWSTLTARVSVPLRSGKAVRLEPFVEIARVNVSPTLNPSGFDPRQFYGSSRIWVSSAGAKLSLGMPHMRMGRYGVANAESRGNTMKHPGMHMMKSAHSHPNQ